MNSEAENIELLKKAYLRIKYQSTKYNNCSFSEYYPPKEIISKQSRETAFFRCAEELDE